MDRAPVTVRIASNWFARIAWCAADLDESVEDFICAAAMRAAEEYEGKVNEERISIPQGEV